MSRASTIVAAALLAGAGLATPAAAQHAGHAAPPQSGVRAEMIRDVEGIEQKLTSLAEAMSGKYTWRPADDVRSVGEVYSHLAGANFMLPMLMGIEPPETLRAGTMQEAFGRMQELEAITDEAQIRENLAHSFRHAKHAIGSVPDADLEDMIEVFGNNVTKRAALMMLVTHMHEHLGQSIAYARSNGVVPPWSSSGAQ